MRRVRKRFGNLPPPRMEAMRNCPIRKTAYLQVFRERQRLTAVISEHMVRRGSPVRVRKRALQKPRKSRRLVWSRLWSFQVQNSALARGGHHGFREPTLLAKE